ncbi:thioredoxin domain-containing protein [Silvibacterium dinghuense]|uniref:Thioredoxin domain-containing protein n=1 Tax=Silvibacterium dinghuense TaxID=1560006 RepID=A0A4Q1SCW9_9BACT|nr:thioredoxin domain-containing protein [Silvibacterium dinghuense]RXS95069.1 thioredoxin domain-containing protein [Silvibacterium dinghuense]GGH10334.1 thioredoxin domain-containing protein [Silvibacterium dinghuense]
MAHSQNALSKARSSYLRSAQHQPIEWHEWGEAAFARAKELDRPVLLDIGAVWCHWCHVMDRESYEDATLAAIVNEHFVAIKVDRDERPDVDSRYQAAVQAISGQGGWPLTAFLTPDGLPFYGGTYFPREDRYGRPGFDRVLLTMANAWKTKREDALDSANSVISAIEHGESFAGRSGSLSLEIVGKLVESAVKQFDPRYGGFGTQPKFPHPSALDLLIDVGARTGHEGALQAATVTLKKMAQGGVYDQLAGGFHRYSVDERWVVPHFEKMLYDNAGLLGNYAHAFQTFVDPEYARVAQDILRWLDTTMTDRERGGFYASQDADINLDDDGDYFTWTRDEAAAVLAPEELEIAGVYFDIGEMGDMHHNPRKNVLHRTQTLSEVAKAAGKSEGEAALLLDAAQKKLMAARRERPEPFIDRTIYTSWNAMAISAYLQTARVLERKDTAAFALKSLDRILNEAWNAEQGLSHVVAYPEGDARFVPGVLDDYAFFGLALVDAWESTGERRWYDAAMQIAEATVTRFYDATGGGFFDREIDGADTIGALAARRKPLQDTPTPAGNPAAAALLLRVEALSGRTDFREKAEDTLEAFGGIVEHFGLYAATYGLALELLMLPPVQVVVIGDGVEARSLTAAARARYAVHKQVLHLRREQVTAENLPPVLAETLPQLPWLQNEGAFAVVCRGASCMPPTRDAEKLLRQMAGE